MVPWYSGTSADMYAVLQPGCVQLLCDLQLTQGRMCRYKTVFDLLISVKLFLGRFDMRTMQVCADGWCSRAQPARQTEVQSVLCWG